MASAGQAESTPATRSVPVARAEGRPRPLLEARARTLDVRIDGFVVKQNGRHRTVLYTIASRAPREEKVCTVSRRYTEFVALYNRLQLLGEPGMPLLPPKHMFGPSFSNTHLAFRVGKLQHFVRWVAGKPDMLKMVEVQSFFGRVHDLAAACAHELEEHGPPLVALASGTPVTGDDDDDWLDGTLVAVLDGKDELLRLDLEEISQSSASEGHTSSECICKVGLFSSFVLLPCWKGFARVTPARGPPLSARSLTRGPLNETRSLFVYMWIGKSMGWLGVFPSRSGSTVADTLLRIARTLPPAPRPPEWQPPSSS